MRSHSRLTVAGIKNLKQTGSIIPSSAFLVKKMIRNIDFNRKINILELGAGTGVITREVLNRMSDHSVLYSYENNVTLINTLESINDSRLIIKAENVSGLHTLQNDYFDVVISSLPLANMAKGFKCKIYRDIKAKLKESGVYIQYQYLFWDYKMIRRSFSKCKLEFCLMNFPPAFVYKMGV
jgi:phospholipid N-methyltransferase